uniref:Uncharacterized protein n=1 Tax=Arundo donax TaxID=35708 RepID=A0A0A8ZWQ5_ARUDO
MYLPVLDPSYHGQEDWDSKRSLQETYTIVT